MLTNPITTIIGVLVALCPIVGAFIPDLKDLCGNLMGELIGLGLIASADGMKIPGKGLPKAMLPLVGGAMIIASTLAACQSLPFLSTKNQLESVVAVTVAGTYTVEVKKDGKTLVLETWTCTQDGGKLTGCHKQ